MDITKIKVLCSSGCSFSETRFWQDYKTWPIQLQQQLKIPNYFHEGRGAQSNNLIRMRLIYRISELLKTYKPEEILVGVMWSGPDRRGVFINNDILETNLSGKSWLDNHNFIDNDSNTGKWAPMLLSHPHSIYHEYYYKYLYDTTGSLIDTLHDILYTQQFLENCGISYFMTNAWNIFEYQYDNWGQYTGNILKYKNKNIGIHEILNETDLNWISNLIEWNAFLPIEGMWEYLSNLNPNRDYKINHHPSENEHFEFTKHIIIPFLHQK